MKELIERLEAATGPDRELDVAIFHVVDPTEAAKRLGRVEHYRYAPEFTASLDAALTLVPDNYTTHICVGGFGPEQVTLFKHGVQTTDRDVRVEAKTGPIALCIAALHAKSAQPSGAEVES